MLQKIKPFIFILICSAVFYLADTFFFQHNYQSFPNEFQRTIESVFLFFTFCSVAIIFLLQRIFKKNIDSVGQTFLLVTSVKMGLAYYFALPILKLSSEIAKVEKYNFLFLFFLFLAIETVVTIRILNKKQ